MLKHLRNHCGNHTATTTSYHVPRDLERLADIVRSARRVRAIGSNMSLNGIAMAGLDKSDVALVSMAKFDRIVEIDPESMTARVEGGVLIEDLLERLRERDLTLPSFPFATGMTVSSYSRILLYLSMYNK